MGETDTENEINEEIPYHPSKRLDRYFCTWPECDRSYSKPSKLAEHLRSHTNERIFVCPVDGCGKSFLRNGHLTRHNLSAHAENNKPFKCPFEGCSASFSLKHHLKRHEMTHTNPRPYQCSFEGCGKAFTKHDQLRRHTCLEHTGEVPFKCTVEGCNAGFSMKSVLKKHVKSAHSVRRYICGVSECTEVFSKWTELVQHRRQAHNKQMKSAESTLESFICEDCGKSFDSERKLNSHSKIHNSVRVKFPCPVEGCGKELLSRSSLSAHMKGVHAGTKSFVCPLCPNPPGKAYSYKQLLRRHMFKVHGEVTVEDTAESVEVDESDFKLVERLIDEVTGSAYFEERDLPCPVEGCSRRFMRQYDLDRHLQSKHSTAEFLE